MSETFLGDGLYVSFDGYQIWLRAPREDGDHRVALEPQVWHRLNEYVAALKRAEPETCNSAEAEGEGG